MDILHNGFHTDCITLETGGNVSVGLPVNISDDDKCAVATANSEFIGVAVSKRNNQVCVQLTGYAEVSYTGSAPTLGYCGLLSAGTNGVKAGDGRKYKVLKVDTAKKTVGFILS